MTPAPVTRPPAHGGRTADRALAAALDLYATDGYKGLSIARIIRETGISSGSLYHHFASAGGLAVALYDRCMSELLDTVVAALESARTVRTGVHAIVVSYLGFVQERRPAASFIHACPYAGFLTGHADRLAASKAPQVGRIAAWLKPHVDAGRIVALPDPLTEMLVIGPVAEISRRWLTGAPGIDLALAARLLPERIWRSIRTR